MNVLPQYLCSCMHFVERNLNDVFVNLYILVVKNSVADPDPDLVGSGLFWSPGSGSEKIPDPDPDPLSIKRPHVIQIFLL